MAKISVLPVFLLVFFSKQGASLKCWNCMSEFDSACKDHFYAEHPGFQSGALPSNLQPRAMDCSEINIDHGQKYTCVKEMIYDNRRRDYIIHRSCTSKRADDTSSTCPPFLLGGSVSYCETCDYDYCNSGSTVKFATALLMPIFSMLLFKH